MPLELPYNPKMINCDLPNDDLDLNVHVEGLHLHRGENRIVLRVTRVNADAKMNVTFSREAACSKHIVDFASRNPYINRLCHFNSFLGKGKNGFLVGPSFCQQQSFIEGS